MARAAKHKWGFKARMRAGAFGWRGSAKAVTRLKAAVSEIKAVRRKDPVAAAEGCVALAERIWPAFEHIDTSYGSLGTAVYRTLEQLLPILIEAPADEPTRAAWLERLRDAIADDGVDYLSPLADRFGEIAAFPALQQDHAERDLDLIRMAWADHSVFSHVPTATLTLSCLLEAGRYDELFALLNLAKTRMWHYEKYGAEALVRQGLDDEALAVASSLLERDEAVWRARDIQRFCEDILKNQGKHDEAYYRFGLPSAAGTTWLAMWRDLIKRYPDRDPRAVLEDLMALYGNKGKWFATAKTAGFLDIALDCAADMDAAPATLTRAARDYAETEPRFAAQVALHALSQLLAGRGYEASPFDIDEAFGYLIAASGKISAQEWALTQLNKLVNSARREDLMAHRLATKLAEFEATRNATRH